MPPAETTMSVAARRVVIGAAIATLMLSLLDTNIVTAAAPTVATDFGGAALSRVPWLVITYTLAETVAQPVYGKLADRHGPRAVLLGSLALFTAGSVACALAGSMTQLVVLRVFQGLGAAGLLSVTFVLIGHLRAGTDDDGAEGNAAAGVMLAIGLIAGPLLGGAVVQHVSWRWIFWINVPIAAAVLVVMLRFLRLPTPTRDDPIDWLAAALLAGAAAAVQLLCVWGGHPLRWLSWPIAGLGLAGLALVAAFARRQRVSPHPYFPPGLLRHATLRRLTLLQLATGIGLAASIVYVTLELQLVRGYTPFDAGLQALPMAVGVVLGAVAGTILVRRRRPLRGSFVVANALCAVAFALLALATRSAPLDVLRLALLALGLGVGLSLGNEMLVVQGVVPLADLGVATTGIRFTETLGTSLGAAAFSVVFAQLVGARMAAAPVAGALGAIFWTGAGVMVLAAWIARGLPAGLTARPVAER